MFETRCPGCGTGIGAVEMLRHYAARLKEAFQGIWYRFWGGRSRVGKVQCPCCRQFSDFSGERCQYCNFKFNLTAVSIWYLLPLIRVILSLYKWFLTSPRWRRVLIVSFYLLTSLALFLWSLDSAQVHFGGDLKEWLSTGTVAVLFTTLLVVAAAFIVPKENVLSLLFLRLPFKIGFTLNFLTFLLFTLAWVKTHEQKALTLVAAFLMALAAFAVFSNLVVPILAQFAMAFIRMFHFRPPNANQRPQSGHYRGRRAAYREGKW